MSLPQADDVEGRTTGVLDAHVLALTALGLRLVVDR
jgi:hypothetical protein